MTTYKDLTDYLVKLGVGNLAHTEKSYLGHLLAVYRDLGDWGCDEAVRRAGMFHSIYGTQKFQGFKLPLESRAEVRALIGDRAEQLAYLNCVILRPSLDAVVQRGGPPYQVTDRLTNATIELTQQDFDDLCRVHLCDWLEQVPRSKEWDYRRDAYRAMAERLGGPALAAFDRVYGLASASPS
jgi:hypothetical protein